jgi:hypothetical protein
MADYYPLVAKAIGALGPNTEETRRQVYDRARAALLSEVHKFVPAWNASEIMAEQLFLELAIGEVEAELQPLQRAPTGPDKPTLTRDEPVSAPPKLPVNDNERRGLGSAGTRGPQNVHRAGSEVPDCDQRLPTSGSTLEESDCVPYTWMTEILAGASRQLDEDFQDLAPKHGRVHRQSSHHKERPNLKEALALWSHGYASCR